MPRTGRAYPEGSGVNSVDVLLNKDPKHWGANNLQPISADRWYYLLRKMNDLSGKADIMTSIVGSMERSLNSLCSRLEDMEVMITSIMNMQLSIASLQLEMEMLEYRGYLESCESNGNTDAARLNKADVRKRSVLVVEDNERAAKAAEGTDRKDATLLNGNAHRVVPTNHAPQSTFRSRFTIPRVPSTYTGLPESPSASSGSGDTVDTVVVAPKTKLKSFQERKEYYHDARFLQSEISLGSSGEPVEKDDEGERHDDNVNPLLNDMKEKAVYVRLPHKPQCTDLPPSLQEPLVDKIPNQLPNESPGKDMKQSNNNKEPEAEVESSCAVDCLYYTLQCCDCSIM